MYLYHTLNVSDLSQNRSAAIRRRCVDRNLNIKSTFSERVEGELVAFSVSHFFVLRTIISENIGSIS
jgi:hypothetical protein